MYAQLGNIVFESLLGFEQFQSKVSQSIAEHALIDGKPRLQRTGTGLEELTISITLHSSFCDPEEQIAELRRVIEDGEILPLLNGNGELIGNFAVREFTNDVVHTDSEGRIILARLSVSLIEYLPADALGAKESQAKNAGFANSDNRPLLRPYTPQFQGGAASAMQSVTEVRAEATGVNDSLYNVANNPSVRQSEIKKAQAGISRMRSSLEAYELRLQEIRDFISNFTQLQNAISSVRTYLNSAESNLSQGNFSGAYNANLDMQRALSRMNSASISVTNLAVTRRL